MHFRRSRRMTGLSQTFLEYRSSVDQTSISRLELAAAPRFCVQWLVLCGKVMGRNLPLGFCPHDHPCPWQPLRPIGRPHAFDND